MWRIARAGFSQERLSGECGFERTYISRVERGILNPTAIRIWAIADALNVPFHDAGAAPNMVAGVLQVNARVPATISGNDLQVIVKVGDSVSPNFLWIDVL